MRLLAFGFLGLLALGACAEEDIVLARVEGTKAGSTTPRRCVSSAECGDGSFCERVDCRAAAGTCAPYPISCDDTESPVCGCNGVNYFNDCLRRAAGASGADASECKEPDAACDDTSCPEGAVCARLIGIPDRSLCKAAVGRCWVLPARCPTPSRSDRWNECSGEPDAKHCVGSCEALQSGKPFVRTTKCE